MSRARAGLALKALGLAAWLAGVLYGLYHGQLDYVTFYVVILALTLAVDRVERRQAAYRDHINRLFDDVDLNTVPEHWSPMTGMDGITHTDYHHDDPDEEGRAA